MLDGSRFGRHQWPVDSAAQFLARLKAAGVTQEQIAEVLGIQQPNAATLYNKSKPRALKWDEGVLLANTFAIEPSSGEVAPKPLASAETLAPILDALLPLVPRGNATDQSIAALSEAVAYGLRLLEESGSSPDSSDALRVAARGAALRFRDRSTQ